MVLEITKKVATSNRSSTSLLEVGKVLAEVRSHLIRMTHIKVIEIKANHIASTKIVISMVKLLIPIVIIEIRIIARLIICKEVLVVASASQIMTP